MIGDAYITRNELASYLGINVAVSDPSRDSKLDTAIAGASNAVENHCRRQFNNTGSATARIFKPTGPNFVEVDDFYDLPSLVVKRKMLTATDWSAALSNTDFELEPMNGVVSGQPGWPYLRIRLPYWTRLYATERVQVTAKWGWAAVPSAVKQATFIIAAQYYKLPDAPLGVAGFGSGSDGFAAVKVRDLPQAWSLLCAYVVDPIWVA